MNKKPITRQMIQMKKEILTDLKNELDEEMNKPPKKRDCARIKELSDSYFRLSCGNNEEVLKSREASKKALINMVAQKQRKNHIKLYKRLSVAAACAVMIIGLNTASLRVFGQNMFSAMYQLSQGGITIDMSQQEEITDENGDPYSMKEKCAEYGFFPETPSYIPNGLRLTDIYENSSDTSNNVKFFYRNGNIKLNFDYHYYKEGEEIPPTGIPTDTYNITEEQINGHRVYILREENQFTATYLENRVVYCIVAHNLDYEIFRMIIENMS